MTLHAPQSVYTWITVHNERDVKLSQRQIVRFPYRLWLRCSITTEAAYCRLCFRTHSRVVSHRHSVYPTSVVSHFFPFCLFTLTLSTCHPYSSSGSVLLWIMYSARLCFHDHRFDHTSYVYRRTRWSHHVTIKSLKDLWFWTLWKFINNYAFTIIFGRRTTFCPIPSLIIVGHIVPVCHKLFEKSL